MRNIKLDDFTNYRFLSEPNLSADKKRCVFVVSQVDEKSTGYHHDLWVHDLSTNTTKQLTASHMERGVIFENNNTILFPADRKGEVKKAKEKGKECTCYYRLSLDGGEAQLAYTIGWKVNTMKLIDDQWAILLVSQDLNEIPTDGLEGEALKEALEQREEEKDVEILDELPYWFNGRGFINKKRTWAVLYNLKTQQSEVLNPKTMDVKFCEISEDKTKLVFAGTQFTSIHDQTQGLYIYHRQSGQCQCVIAQSTYSFNNAGWLENELVVVATDNKTWGSSENSKFYVVNQQTGSMSCLCEEDLSLGSSVGSDVKLYGGRSWKIQQDKIWFLTTHDNHSELTTLNLHKELMTITSELGSVDCFDVVDEQVVYIAMRKMKLQELYQIKDNQECPCTHLNEEVLQDCAVAQPKLVSFINSDQVRIDGWVLEPYQFDPHTTYPAILDIHGGPKAVYGEVFMHEMQYWAAQGYFVFFCNPRGSDGRGNEFMDLRGKYGTVDYADIMDFTDTVLANYPSIDSQRIGVTGGSYGGFMTNWIIGHTNRFKAAVSQRSISNWFSKSLTTDIGYYHNMSQMDTTPWLDAEKMWGFSPLKYADKCTTPTLFIHSDQDYRCWMAEALQMFQALKLHGVESRICLFHGENHELSRSGKPKHRIRRLSEITQWMDQYLDNLSDLSTKKDRLLEETEVF